VRNADQLRSLEINSLIFSNSWQIFIVLNQILESYLLLWFRPEKHCFVRSKASCGAMLLTAKLVSHYQLANLSQKQSFFNLAVQCTSCLKQLRMTFPHINYSHEFKKENSSQFLN